MYNTSKFTDGMKENENKLQKMYFELVNNMLERHEYSV